MQSDLRSEMSKADTVRLGQALETLAGRMCEAERTHLDLLSLVHPGQEVSALNLLHYLVLRSHDLRNLQEELHEHGLSSLASSESHALAQVQATLQHLGKTIPASEISNCSYETGKKILNTRRFELFGTTTQPAIPHIMVTFDTDFAGNYYKVRDLLLGGMNIARINCAHDDIPVWKSMISQIRRAEKETGRSCKIYMDLAGPKMRTLILGKGRQKGRVKVSQGSRLFLSEPDADIPPYEPVIGCSLPGIVSQLKPGERVLFDDGMFEARVDRVQQGIALLQMIRVSAKKPRIKAEKGINFPDTNLKIDSLTEEDRQILPFIREYADLIGYSFVRTAEDVKVLDSLLYTQDKEADKGKKPALILKIETPRAVQNLPALLFQGMKYQAFGVMIARGDLAVEIGFERLSEIQEEILWVCEAAHVPVIWATQVLDNLNKTGLATRAEVTDAAHGAMAECVMINKGAYLLDVLQSLQDILIRTGGHRLKKRYTLRALGIAKSGISKNYDDLWEEAP